MATTICRSPRKTLRVIILGCLLLGIGVLVNNSSMFMETHPRLNVLVGARYSTLSTGKKHKRVTLFELTGK